MFRKFLVNRCQEDFEERQRATKAQRDANAEKAAAGEATAEKEEAELLSDEYYAAQKVKRRALGLVKFIGELFKQNMLHERTLSACVGSLFVANPEEEDIEALTKLIGTIGKWFEANPKTQSHVILWFQKIDEVIRSDILNPRMRFMLMV